MEESMVHSTRLYRYKLPLLPLPRSPSHVAIPRRIRRPSHKELLQLSYLILSYLLHRLWSHPLTLVLVAPPSKAEFKPPPAPSRLSCQKVWTGSPRRRSLAPVMPVSPSPPSPVPSSPSSSITSSSTWTWTNLRQRARLVVHRFNPSPLHH